MPDKEAEGPEDVRKQIQEFEKRNRIVNILYSILKKK